MSNEEELRLCYEYYLELAVEASGMREAKELIQYIMEKK